MLLGCSTVDHSRVEPESVYSSDTEFCISSLVTDSSHNDGVEMQAQFIVNGPSSENIDDHERYQASTVRHSSRNEDRSELQPLPSSGVHQNHQSLYGDELQSENERHETHGTCIHFQRIF